MSTLSFITVIIVAGLSSLTTLIAPALVARIKRYYTRIKPKSLQERIREEVTKQLKDIIND